MKDLPIVVSHRQGAKFCRHCGKGLVPDLRVSGYDDMTGLPTQPWKHQKICPSRDCKGSPHYASGAWG